MTKNESMGPSLAWYGIQARLKDFVITYKTLFNVVGECQSHVIQRHVTSIFHTRFFSSVMEEKITHLYSLSVGLPIERRNSFEKYVTRVRADLIEYSQKYDDKCAFPHDYT